MAVSHDEFRQTLRHFAAGVTVVTARCADGLLAGITVTAFSSLSLNPPLVLVCIDRRAFLHDRLEVGRPFAVNFLAADQEPLSNRFAKSGPDQFAGVPHRIGTAGAPLLDGVLGSLECEVVERLPGGDHTIVVGRVDSAARGAGRPLLYYDGRYGRLAE